MFEFTRPLSTAKQPVGVFGAMGDEILATMVGVLGGAILAGVTLAGAYLMRRVHELSDRILAMEIAVQRLRVLEQDFLASGRGRARRR